MPRAELLRKYPGKDAAFLDNSLTTAKRAFRRIILDVIPLGLRDGATPTERFAEWMEILSRSNASQFDLLQLAYRVAPFVPPNTSQAPSAELVVEGVAQPWGFDEEVRIPSDDEMRILLSFRLALPLTEMIGGAGLPQFIPASSPFWPAPGGRSAPGSTRPTRPICLLTLLDPTPAEAAALAEVDLLGLLRRLKSHVKQLHNRPDHAVPPIFAPLFYTILSVLAMLRCGVALHSIDHASLAGNVSWFLEQPWIDASLRPLFRSGIALGGAPPATQEAGRPGAEPESDDLFPSPGFPRKRSGGLAS